MEITTEEKPHHIACNADGSVSGYHGPTIDNANPLTPPIGGYCESVPPQKGVEIRNALASGIPYRMSPTPGIAPMRLKPKSPKPSLTEVIKRAFWKFADEATKVRDRRPTLVDNPLPLKGLEFGRQSEIGILLANGRLKKNEKIIITNWHNMKKTEVTVGQWLDYLEENFRIRQDIRRREMDLRDRLAGIYRSTDSDDAKIAAIQAIDIPEYLGLGEAEISTLRATVRKRKRKEGE